MAVFRFIIDFITKWTLLHNSASFHININNQKSKLIVI